MPQELEQPEKPIISSNAGMYLSKITLSGFRSCRETHVKLRPQLTLLVGENNSGKSNIIDGIRLVTGPLSGKRHRYFGADDHCDYAGDQSIEIACQFSGLTDMQHGRFLTAIDIVTGIAHYSVRHVPDESITPRLRTSYLTGPQPGPDPEPENRARINHVYLPPLRNAQEALDSAQGGRLTEIVRSLTTKEEQEDFLGQANSSLACLVDHQVVTTSTAALKNHLGRLTNPVRGQDVKLSFQSMKLHRLIRSLRIKMAESGVDPADLAQSGLGYANLLYVASVILELQSAPDSELTIFLVEEPEAHLHPQLQSVLLDYLLEQTASSVHGDTARPVGRIQVIATTHSPNLASSVGIDNVVVVKRDQPQAATPGDTGTVTLPLADVPLTPDERRKINQYLDVTRSELLFGRNAMLVEGIAEAVLLLPLSQKVFDLADEDDIASHRRFRAAAIINIGNVDFTPYIKLLAQAVDGVRLTETLVIITDGDPDITNSAADSTDDDDDSVNTVYNRKDNLDALAEEIGAASSVHVYASRYTLEADLLEPIDRNKPAMRAAFILQKPRSGARFDGWAASDHPSLSFYAHLRDKKNKKYLAKGEFAHDLALQIADVADFACPDYLVKAIRKVASGT